ncbi:MAG: di-heme oxidoredictase family protein, partial [Porticoccaceae bacterium]
DANAGPQSDYCSAPLYHLGMEGETLSLVNLTIENVNSDTVRVSIITADTSAVDELSVEGGSGASISDDPAASGGAYAKLLNWSGGMPDNTTVTILWSKITTGAMWIERDIPVVTAATCGGSNSGGGSGDGGNNTSDPDGPAPTPTEDAANVLSIFSDSYTDISNVNFNPAWGQATTVTVADGEISYVGLNYQGTTFGGPQDVSGYEYFHIDVLPESSSTLQLYLINSGAVTGGGPVETYFDLNLSVNQWNSIDIPLSSFSAVVDLSQVDEIKIVGTGNLTLDNLYFGGVSENNNGGSGNGGDDYTGGGTVPTEEISVANGILVGGVNSSNPGFTVYLFDNDSDSVSSCYGGCASAWPPVYVEDGTASGVSNLSSITRNDGTEQVTYNGMPLYFYAGDQQAGDRSGDNVAGWHSIEYGNIGLVNTLYNDSTPLEPETTFTRDDGVIVTRLADRGRDRHAKDSGVQDHYDHYLAHYWQFRTMRIQLEDYVPIGQSLIKVTWITESALGAKEFRVWYAGQNTTGQFWFNPQPEGQQANPDESAVVSHGSGTWNDDFEKISSTGQQHKYTLNIVNRWQLGGQIQEPLQMGMDMEFEASMFLSNPPAGSRLNYYGTSFVYKVGQPGLHPFEWEIGQQDGTPIPQRGLSGGGTTLGYNYTNEPAGRFMQMATNMAPGNAEPFVLGRRVHHTSFVNGVHGERSDNPVWTQQAGKAGKHYVSDSCASCHVRNGKALVADVGEELEKWVFNVGDENGDPMSSIGRVLQPLKIGAGTSEGTVTLGPWTEHTEGEFAGLRSPNYQFSNGTPPQFSARIAPQLVGMGLLEAVDETTIMSWVDETDEDNNGISGRASMVEDPVSGVMRLGRFGYKAATFSVKHQVASAFNTDMGVMTSMIPTPDCGSEQTDCGNASGSELADEHVDNLVKYVSLLGVGARRDYDNQGGESLFENIGCAGCHRPSMVTSNNHPLAELRGQTIYPYTDMLLHDMGEGLADNLAEGSASGAEWRTAPLWGLGLVKNVMLGDAKGNDLVSLARDYPADLNRIGYLHDGRARTIDEAIRWHGGEAQASKVAYEALNDSERNAVLNFLESL